jgi:Cu(I)/Ag(I) efflux system membrane protein CusA/SilA
MMTVVAIMAGLLPIMWGTGTGSEVMSRIAAPMVTAGWFLRRY